MTENSARSVFIARNRAKPHQFDLYGGKTASVLCFEIRHLTGQWLTDTQWGAQYFLIDIYSHIRCKADALACSAWALADISFHGRMDRHRLPRQKRRTMSSPINSFSAPAALQSQGVSKFYQRQQGIKDLSAALQSGSLETAQKVFASLANGRASAPSNVNASNPLAQIGQALKSGGFSVGTAPPELSPISVTPPKSGGFSVGTAPPESSPISVTPPNTGIGALLNELA
jgi:hypothetical protein